MTDGQAGKERHPVEPIRNPESEADALTALWERSVRATHLFLAEDDIVSLRPAVREGIACVECLFVVRNADGVPEGFMGTTGNKLEMLFAEWNMRM